MKLKSLQIFPNGPNGWETEVFTFGDHITQLFGPNGCGKTPIIQSIAYCLGYPSVFRNDIYERCNHVVLEVEFQDNILEIKRVYSKDVDIEVTEPNGSKQRFFNEADYSKYIFEWFDLETSNLLTTSNTVTQPYLATILPFFYVDQDDGYSGIYCPPSKFIKDQFSEMMRILFRLPVKHSFDAKKAKIDAKRRLDYLDKVVKEQSRQVELAKESISGFDKSGDDLSSEISKLERELEDLKCEGISQSDSTNSIDRLIAMHKNSLHEIEFEFEELIKRRDSVSKIIAEINIEINTLNLNEEARRVFLSFDEICGSKKCLLFSTSSDSYGKNLLYLKDQLKDLERNDKTDQMMIDRLKQEKLYLQNLICQIVDERNANFKKGDTSSVVNAASEFKNEIFRLQYDLKKVEEFEIVKQRLFNAVIERDKILDQYESFDSVRSSNPNLIRLRADMRQLFLDWMDELHTTNVSRDISFKDDFAPVLGMEPVSQLKGSTKVRAVLAFHATILELAARNNSPFKFLILDTPKQHEIHNLDLDRYFCALKGICKKYALQIVFSTTEYEYSQDAQDKRWTPPYPAEEQLMFMRKARVL